MRGSGVIAFRELQLGFLEAKIREAADLFLAAPSAKATWDLELASPILAAVERAMTTRSGELTRELSWRAYPAQTWGVPPPR
jgi:hypothetical protein